MPFICSGASTTGSRAGRRSWVRSSPFATWSRSIPLDTAVDELSIQGLVAHLGYRLVYEPDAVVYNRGPTTVGDFLRQRRRIYAGHLRIRDQQSYSAPTMNAWPILRALGGSGSFSTPRAATWSVGTIALELIARALGHYDVMRRRQQHVWEISATTKRDIAAGADGQGQQNVLVFHIADFQHRQLELGAHASRLVDAAGHRSDQDGSRLQGDRLDPAERDHRRRPARRSRGGGANSPPDPRALRGRRAVTQWPRDGHRSISPVESSPSRRVDHPWPARSRSRCSRSNPQRRSPPRSDPVSLTKVIPRIPALKATYRTGRVLSLPVNITVSGSYRCNSRCKTCNVWLLPNDDMTLEEWDRTFESLGRAPYWFTFSGGEPTLRKDLPDMVGSAYRHCRPGIINIPTNGIQQKIIPGSVERVLQVAPKSEVIINLSLDGVGLKHDEIRGVRNNWDRAMVTYAALKELQKAIRPSDSRDPHGDLELQRRFVPRPV